MSARGTRRHFATATQSQRQELRLLRIGNLPASTSTLQANAYANFAAARYRRTSLQAATEGGHMTIADRLRQAGALQGIPDQQRPLFTTLLGHI